MATYINMAGVIGSAIKELNKIYDTNERLIKSHTDAIAERENQKNNGDSIGNVSQA